MCARACVRRLINLPPAEVVCRPCTPISCKSAREHPAPPNTYNHPAHPTTDRHLCQDWSSAAAMERLAVAGLCARHISVAETPEAGQVRGERQERGAGRGRETGQDWDAKSGHVHLCKAPGNVQTEVIVEGVQLIAGLARRVVLPVGCLAPYQSGYCCISCAHRPAAGFAPSHESGTHCGNSALSCDAPVVPPPPPKHASASSLAGDSRARAKQRELRSRWHASNVRRQRLAACE